jgi:hypothetical protein
VFLVLAASRPGASRPIDLTPAAYLDYDDQAFSILDGINNAVIALADAIPFLPRKFF